MSNQPQTQTPKMSLAEKYAYGLAIAGSASMGASADTVDVTSVVSSITGLGAPIAAIGGAMLTLYVVIKGWKVVRRAL